jgi:hypothetical protein
MVLASWLSKLASFRFHARQTSIRSAGHSLGKMGGGTQEA